MSLKRFALVALLVAVLSLGTSSAWANSLPAGGTVTSPDSLTMPAGDFLTQSTTLYQLDSNGNPTINVGTLYSAVAGTPGNYDFVYQMYSNGTDANGFNTLVVNDFSNLAVDVGWTQSSILGNPLGAFAPSQVSRASGVGNIINWNFSPNVTGWSDVLIVATNSVDYTSTLDYTGDDSPSLAFSAFGPSGGAAELPEPSCMMGLFGLLSMAGLGLAWRRKR